MNQSFILNHHLKFKNTAASFSKNKWNFLCLLRALLRRFFSCSFHVAITSSVVGSSIFPLSLADPFACALSSSQHAARAFLAPSVNHAPGGWATCATTMGSVAMESKGQVRRTERKQLTEKDGRSS